MQRAGSLHSHNQTIHTKHKQEHSDHDRSTKACKGPRCHGMTGPHEWRALCAHLISQDPRGRAGDPPHSQFQVLKCGKLIAAHRSECLRAGRENDRPCDPKSLQLGPPRLGRPKRSDEGDRRLLSYELCKEPLNANDFQCFLREPPRDDSSRKLLLWLVLDLATNTDEVSNGSETH